MENMPDFTSTIFLGVISGILTSAALFLLIEIFNKIIVPWYQDLVYKGIDLSGTWYVSNFYMSQEVTFYLTQETSKIYGTATVVNKGKSDHEIEDIRNFTVTGFTQDRFVHLLLKHKDSSRLGFISYLLESVGDGRKMLGAISYYNVVGHEIDFDEEILWREKSQADADREEQRKQEGRKRRSQLKSRAKKLGNNSKPPGLHNRLKLNK